MSALNFNRNMMPYYFGRGVISNAFKVGRSTLYRWRRCYRRTGLSAPCMTAAKHRARGASASGRNPVKRPSSMTKLGSVNEPSPDILVGSFVAENGRFSERVSPCAGQNFDSSKVFELMKPFCVCCRIFGKASVVHDETWFCQ